MVVKLIEQNWWTGMCIKWASHSCSALIWPCSSYQNNKIHTCRLVGNIHRYCVNIQHMKKPSGAANQTLISSLNNIFSHLTSTAASRSQSDGHGGESTHQRLHGPLKGKKLLILVAGLFPKKLEKSLIPLIPSEPMAKYWLSWGPGLSSQLGVTHPWVCLSGQPSAPAVCLRQDWWSTGGHLRPQRRIKIKT